MAFVMDTRDGGSRKKSQDLSEEIRKSASLAAQSQSSTMKNAQARQNQQKSASQTLGSVGTGSSSGTAGGTAGSPAGYLAGSTASAGPSSGYLTGYNPQPFSMSDYARDYRDRLSALEADKPGPFESRYQPDIDNILETIMGRESFDPDSVYQSDMWKNYRDQYMQQGNRAMRDAQGAAAGLTGGYGSTYALAAGQQAYDNYLSQLNDRTLDIHDRLYQQYLDEGQELYNQLGALNNQDAIDYSRYRDDVSDYQWNLGYLSDRYEQARGDDYQEYVDDIARQQWAEQYAYQRTQDALAQQNWQAEFDYQKQQDALAQQNWQTEFAYQKQKDAAAAAQRASSSGSSTANKSTGSKSSGSAVTGYPYSNEYYETLRRTVSALPTNAARFSYLYTLASTDDELEYLMQKFGVTPESESEEDKDKKAAGANLSPVQRKQSLYDALRGNILR